MAITANAIEVVNDPVGGASWAVSAYSADVTGGEVLKAAEVGYSHYISKILVHAQSVTDITVTIGGGPVASSTVTTIYLGPIPLSDTGGIFLINFGKRFMKVGNDVSLAIDTSATCPIFVYVEGKTCRN